MDGYFRIKGVMERIVGFVVKRGGHNQLTLSMKSGSLVRN